MSFKYMKSVILLSMVLSMLCIPATTVLCQNSHHGAYQDNSQPMKKGILLVAFGTSIPKAQIAFNNIEKKVQDTFPGISVRWAYTSSIIRHKLAKRGKILDSTAMALAKMMDEGFTHVAVQSLHTIGGAEYHDMVRIVKAYKNLPGGIKRILIGNPLLSSQADIEAVTDAIIANIPKKLKRREAVVLMGHGTHHPANAFYAALAFNLQQKNPNIFVGTVEGSPEIDDIKAMLKDKKIKRAYLMPFMSVAGDHAINDMASSEPDSWKSILHKAGIKCKAILKGTAEFDTMVDIWVDHLKVVMAHFNR